MYVIKHIPEDFVVIEDSSVVCNSGPFVVFKLKKRNISTMEAVSRIARALHVPLHSISFAGLKDKCAVSEQICSIKAPIEHVEKLVFDDMKLSVLGTRFEPVHLGELKGNFFKIVVRNLDVVPKINSRFKNLFGEQRFGSHNADIGRHLIRKEFDKAVALIDYSDYRFSSYKQKSDWLSALRCLPKKLLSLYVHAFQSFLWNRAVLCSNLDVLPVVGFGSDNLDECTKKVLSEENVKSSDFVVRSFPEISVEGSERSVWSDAVDLKISVDSDEFFKGKKKVVLEFFLSKGCYATEFVKQSFESCQ